MTIRLRIMLMGMLAFLGIASFLAMRLGGEVQAIANRNAVMADIVVAEQLSELVHELQKERGLSAGFLGGDETVMPLLAIQRTHSDRRLEALGASAAHAATHLVDLGQSRQLIATRAIGASQSFRYYSATILELLHGIETIAEKSASRPLQERLFAHAHFLFAKEYLGQMRASLMEALAARVLGNEMVARLGRLQGQLELHKAAAMKHSSPALAEAIGAAFLDRHVETALATVDLATRHPETVLQQTTAGEWFALATAAIDVLKTRERGTLDEIKAHAENERTRAELGVAATMVSTVAFAALLLWLAISSTRRILRALDILLGGVERVVVTRDFGHRIPLYSYDEMGRITHSFNELLDIAEELIHEKDAIASNDPLTGAFNRYKFRELFERNLQHEKRYRGGMALVFLDVDQFKRINDCHGHGVGDAVLVELAKLMQGQIRATDVLARWGGEEFVILVPQGGVAAALALAENIRGAVASRDFAGVGSVTVSLGVTAYVDGDSLESLCQRADYALYHAKEEGRNRVCVRLAAQDFGGAASPLLPEGA